MHMKSCFTGLLLFSIVSILVSCSSERDQTGQTLTISRELDFTATVFFERSPGKGTGKELRAAVADTDASRSEGLMNVQTLPGDAGMLFIFEGEEPRSFWMANTPLPLDIIFANQSGEIVRIHRNTIPFSHESIRSEYPTTYVVEVNAGYTLRNDINEGMFISYTMDE